MTEDRRPKTEDLIDLATIIKDYVRKTIEDLESLTRDLETISEKVSKTGDKIGEKIGDLEDLEILIDQTIDPKTPIEILQSLRKIIETQKTEDLEDYRDPETPKDWRDQKSDKV